MDPNENSGTTGNSPTKPVGVAIPHSIAEDGKIRISSENFALAFRKVLQGVPVQELHADPSTFKTNPVTPGVGSRVIGADTWFKRYLKSAKDSADDWEERALTPRNDPILRAIANNEKRKDRLKEAEDQEKWLKTMQKRSFADVAEGIQSVKASGYAAGVEAKKNKADRRYKELQPLVETLAKSIDGMSSATKKDRGEKMLAARDGMLEIGNKLRGITS